MYHTGTSNARWLRHYSFYLSKTVQTLGCSNRGITSRKTTWCVTLCLIGVGRNRRVLHRHPVNNVVGTLYAYQRGFYKNPLSSRCHSSIPESLLHVRYNALDIGLLKHKSGPHARWLSGSRPS
eukprot:210265-Pelagomonas_calceolata.AAC.13